MYQQMFELHAELLKALAHPHRLEILQLLRGQSMPVTDIHTMLDLPQANISQHLQILRDAGVVKTKKKGKQVYYSAADKKFIRASDLMRSILIERHGKNMGDELAATMSDLVPVVKDPTCGMRVSPKTAGHAYKDHDLTYYFCASGCYKKFLAKHNV